MARRIEELEGPDSSVPLTVGVRLGEQVQLTGAALTGLPTINDRDDSNRKAFAHDGKGRNDARPNTPSHRFAK